MKKFLLVLVFGIIVVNAGAQVATDTTEGGSSVIVKDARIELLAKKMTEHNAAVAASNAKPDIIQTSSTGIVLTQGYRLMVISTSDRELAMKVRAQLYQYFPDQKQYMSFQMPNTKIKFGNFLDRSQADQARKKIMAMKLVTNNIYVLPDTVEMKVEKKDPNDKSDDKDNDKKKGMVSKTK